MRAQTISFIQANIEVGQTKEGLVASASQFLEHFYKRQNEAFHPEFSLMQIGYVEQSIHGTNPKFFSNQELNEYGFEIYRHLTELSLRGLEKNKLNLNFGGDHSVALATVEASLRVEPNTLVIWIDAHADLNSAEGSPSGNFHGMPVYYLMQNPENRPSSLSWMQSQLKPEQMVYIGLRDIDPFEKEFLHNNNITYFTVHDIRTQGLKFVLHCLEKKAHEFSNIHLSFDIDSLDTAYPLCTGVPVDSGLHLQELMQILYWISETKKLRNFDIVEINPSLASSAQGLKQTYEIALQLISAISKERNPYATNDQQQLSTDSARA